jgi:hypothetical protein
VEDSDFDPAKLRLSPEMVPTDEATKTTARAAKRRPAKWWDGRPFVIVSPAWFSHAAEVLEGTEMAVALGIFWRMSYDGTTVKLTSDTMRRFGVFTNGTRNRALEKLEAAGLLRLERHSGSAPNVTVHLDAERKLDSLAALVQRAVETTGCQRFRPADLLVHLKAQADYPTTAPQNVRQLVAALRKLGHEYVRIRRGYTWVFCPPP